MRKLLLIALLLVQTFGCSGSDYTIPEPVAPTTPTKPEQPEPPTASEKYVSSVEELKALGVLAAGDVIICRNGTYADAVIELKGSGTASKPITLRAETPGGACFTGTSRITLSGSNIVVSGLWWRDPQPVSGKSVITFAKGSSLCVVRDCAITGDNTQQNGTVDTKWVSLYGTQNRVEGSTLRDKRNIGCLMVVWLEAGIVPRHTISGNHFERPATLYGTDGKAINGQETIRIGTSDVSMQDAACTVEGNYFYHCHGEQAEIVSNKSCRNTYRGNLFVECQGTLTMRHGNNCTITGNYFFGNGMEGTGGIRLIGEGHTAENNYLEGLAGTGYRTAICLVRGQQNAALSGYWQVKNAIVRGNTVFDCKYAFNVNYGSGDQVLPVIGTRIENNTVCQSDASSYAVKCYTSPAPEITWRENKIYGGKMDGVTLDKLPQAPAKPDVTVAVAAIRDGAGCSWEKK